MRRWGRCFYSLTKWHFLLYPMVSIFKNQLRMYIEHIIYSIRLSMFNFGFHSTVLLFRYPVFFLLLFILFIQIFELWIENYFKNSKTRKWITVYFIFVCIWTSLSFLRGLVYAKLSVKYQDNRHILKIFLRSIEILEIYQKHFLQRNMHFVNLDKAL